MTINGKEYQFHKPTLNLLKSLAKAETELDAMISNGETFVTLVKDEEKYEKFKVAWSEFVHKAFVTFDEFVQDPGNFSFGDIMEIRKSFFGGAVGLVNVQPNGSATSPGSSSKV